MREKSLHHLGRVGYTSIDHERTLRGFVSLGRHQLVLGVCRYRQVILILKTLGKHPVAFVYTPLAAHYSVSTTRELLVEMRGVHLWGSSTTFTMKQCMKSLNDILHEMF